MYKHTRPPTEATSLTQGVVWMALGVRGRGFWFARVLWATERLARLHLLHPTQPTDQVRHEAAASSVGHELRHQTLVEVAVQADPPPVSQGERQRLQTPRMSPPQAVRSSSLDV